MPIEIRDDDFHLEVRIGGRVRRALIRHFVAFLKAKITERGYSADDPELFDQDRIEGKAWDLAEGVITDAETRAGQTITEIDGIHEAVEALGGDPTPLACVREALAEALGEAERGVLDDPLGGNRRADRAGQRALPGDPVAARPGATLSRPIQPVLAP